MDAFEKTNLTQLIYTTPLANAIKNKRLELKLTRQALANRMGVRPETIWTWESARLVPSIQYLVKLCAALEVTPNDLLIFPPQKPLKMRKRFYDERMDKVTHTDNATKSAQPKDYEVK